MRSLAFVTFFGLNLIQVFGQDISTDETETRYLLYTRENQGNNEEQILIYGNASNILESHFDGSKPTKILVHGYNDNGKTGWVMSVKNEYLIKEDCNVISVDWTTLAGPVPWYGIAVENAKNVGRRTGELIQLIMETTGTTNEDIHVVGFSLGGQLVSHIGYYFNGTLKRITGLDPAGFLYHTAPPEEKLTPDDAQFVDVIHSAGLWVGTDERIGHVDFYPNGGMAPQPGCESENAFSIDCSHARAPKFFEESINSETGFTAHLCGSWEDFMAGLCVGTPAKLMGEPADISREGIYFLRTNAERPFAIPEEKN